MFGDFGKAQVGDPNWLWIGQGLQFTLGAKACERTAALADRDRRPEPERQMAILPYQFEGSVQQLRFQQRWQPL
ncbi:MAG: hypothetical protein JSS49_10515 [Planctomycetes bacterium]|nr:hypothetical protein [Planctomycetota bacterium]